MKHIFRRLLFRQHGKGAIPVPLVKAPRVIERLNSYSMCGREVLEKHYLLGTDIVRRNIPGDFVECGVCNGGSAAAFCCALRDTGRRAWLYDSFQGMPLTTEEDGSAAASYIGACVGAEDQVKEAVRIVGFPQDNIIIRKGWFQDTFLSPLPKTIALLHLDCDWYESVLLSLRTFYDLVSPGGIILLDDFGHWEGCREAFYDYAQERKLKPLLERFSYAQAFWVKERTHNREFKGKWEIP